MYTLSCMLGRSDPLKIGESKRQQTDKFVDFELDLKFTPVKTKKERFNPLDAIIILTVCWCNAATQLCKLMWLCIKYFKSYKGTFPEPWRSC